MPISIVVGGQYGSEGKGKVAHYLAREMKASFAVRCGGPNSGHTVIGKDGAPLIFQQLPTAAILPDVKLAICAGSYIDLDVLFKDIDQANLDAGRLFIDPDAVIITKELKQQEASGNLINEIGSTGSGTGAAVSARVSRIQSLIFAKDIGALKPFCADVATMLRDALGYRERIILEGTQGFGLSPLHSRSYPFVTSRDTTAAAFLSETGLSPFDVDDIVLTLRTFPIRVSGNSGPLQNEICWDELSTEIGKETIERTSVSNKIRRVARFEPEIVRRAILCNSPSRIVLNHLDYIKDVKESRVQLLDYVQKTIQRSVDFVGLSPWTTVSNANSCW